MTTLPQSPRELLTVDDFLALPEENEVRFELQEGIIMMSPRPIPRHMKIARALTIVLDAQAPGSVELLPEVDVDLELAGRAAPGFVRCPDLVIVPGTSYERVDSEGGILKASDVLLAVEIHSPGTRQVDDLVKRHEYAAAGIPNYWIVDVEHGVSLRACRLVGESYVDDGEVTGVFATTEPFDLRLDLDALL